MSTLGTIKRPRKTNQKYMDGLPIDGNGVLALPQQPPRPIIDHFYEIRGIEHGLVQEILTDKFFSFIDAMCQGDETAVRAMAEKRFADKIAANLAGIQKSGIKFQRGKGLVETKKDDTDYGNLRQNLVSDIEDTYVVDSVIIKGVSVNRDENDCNYDYNLLKNMDNQGMRFYMHKYFSGHMHYYLMQKYQDHVKRLEEIATADESRYAETKPADSEVETIESL